MQSFLYFNPNGHVRFKAYLECANCEVCGALTRCPYDFCTLCLRTTKHLMISPYVCGGEVMNGMFANKIGAEEGDIIYRPTRPAPARSFNAGDIPGDIILSLSKLEVIDAPMRNERYGQSRGVYVWDNFARDQDGTFLDGATQRVAACFIQCAESEDPNVQFQYDDYRGPYVRCINRNIRQGDALTASYNDGGRWRAAEAAGWRYTTYHGW